MAIILITSTTGVDSVYAWDDCPKGKVNDPYPGDCARYIDTDNNGICDHSEPAPEDRESGSSENIDNLTTENSSNNVIKDTVGQTETKSLANLIEKSYEKNTESKVINTNSFWSKSELAVAVVAFHLIGLLIYASYRKAKT